MMAVLNVPQQPILYQNTTNTVILVDIPRSLSFAQGTQSYPCTHEILSSPAQQTPHPSTEPKSEIAKANVLRMKAEGHANARFPEASLVQALDDIIGSYKDDVWCLQRKTLSQGETQQTKKLKRRRSAIHLIGIPSDTPPDLIRSQTRHATSPQSMACDLMDLATLRDSPGKCMSLNSSPIINHVCYNSCSNPLPFKFTEAAAHFANNYKIPPHAVFLLSKITQCTALVLSMAAVSMYPDSSLTAGRGQFDFILLDPPWDNRSVRRSSKYATMRQSQPMEVLQNMLGQHIAPGGFVACWITNKASVRDAALEAFERWNVELVEEWAWLKVTASGEPVTAIDGLWRKPYEILLLGRQSDQLVEENTREVSRRVIVGVPDLHSRKPNLKTLIEPLLPAQYRAMEIFARNLTAGWWAWGDEVLKYNWTGHWVKDDECTEPRQF